MSSIRLEQIAKHWGESRALDGITFSAEPGSFVVLLGPSGCGKSTTLRLIAGLDTPTSGTIRIGERDVTRLAPAQRGISMVFQSYALFPHLTVAENIVFGLRVRKTPGRDAKLKRVAEMLGLMPLLARKPSQLSGGQQQRVALGRALVAETPVCLMDEPLSNLDAQLRGEIRQRVALGRALVAETPVCLMDEPLSNLDAQLRGEMRREIRSLQQRLGITMVYVTHDQTEAMTMADRVVLLRNGRIEQVGSPEDLYARPASAFTAGFIGAPPMNLLAPNGAGTVTGVRPEDMRLAAEGLEASVESTEYLGADSLVAAKAGADSILVRVPGHARVKKGDAVRLAWDAAHEHHFDAQTGGRKP